MPMGENEKPRQEEAEAGADPLISWRPRLIPSGLHTRAKRIYVGATLFFCLVFLATLWPIHAVFSRIEPFVLGLPFSLSYLAALLILTFAVLLALFIWEGREGKGRGEGE